MQGLPNELAQGLSEFNFAAFQDRGPRSFLAQVQQRAGLGQEYSASTDLLHKPAANNQGKSPGAPAPCSPIASEDRKVEAAAAESFSLLIAPSSPLPWTLAQTAQCILAAAGLGPNQTLQLRQFCCPGLNALPRPREQVDPPEAWGEYKILQS